MLSCFGGESDDGKTFKYNSLNIDAEEIRLLCLRPALLLSAPIKCSIKHYSLAKPFKYVALSYAWGNATAKKKAILLNGAEFLIQPNLESALRHLRQTAQLAYFWVDAICINQKDTEERAQQVRFMQHIYKKAKVVIAWLGPAYEDSDRAMQLVKTISKRFCKGGGKVTPKFLEWMISTASPSYRDCGWEPLVALLQRPWWSRVWVIQEVTLASAVFVFCGSQLVNLSDFFIVHGAISRCIQHLKRRLHVPEHDERRLQIMFQIVYAPDFDGAMRQTLSVFDNVLISGLSGTLALLLNYSPTSLLQVVINYRTFQATDPRDKIYGLLGLIPDRVHKDVLAFRPKYDMPVEHLYADFARHCIKEGSLVETLEECQGPRQIEGLPSWTPDWTTNPRSTRLSDLTFEPYNVFNASGDLEASFPFSSNGDILGIDGIIFDVVGRLSPEFVSQDPPNFKQIAAVSLCTLTGKNMKGQGLETKSVDDIEKFYAKDLGRQYVAGGTLYNAWRRTLHASQSYSIDQIQSAVEDQFQLPSFVPKKRPTTDVGWDLRLSAVLNHRRYSISSHGYTCLVPAETEVDDLICIFLGASVPFVIRKQEGHYILVGECYVQGLMDAEAVKKVESGVLEICTLKLV